MADSDLLTSIEELLGVDHDTAISRLETLTVDQTMDLLDAVVQGDQSRALEIFNANESSEDNPDEDEAVTENAGDNEYYPNPGDEVIVNGKKGSIAIARAPNDTVGVTIDGELTMVKRSDVKRVKVSESVLGMTMMPNLTRMQELAGITPTAESTPTEIVSVSTPEVNFSCLDLNEILSACDSIEASLPELRVKDAKVIRQRLSAMITKLNESRR